MTEFTGGGGGLPSPEDLKEPKSQIEAVKMLELSQKLMQLGCQYLEPSLSNEVGYSQNLNLNQKCLKCIIF